MYNVVFEFTKKHEAKWMTGKHGHKHFDNVAQAERWIEENKKLGYKPLKLQVWDEGIDCYATIKTY